MRDVEIVDEYRIDETVHLDDRVALRVQRLRLRDDAVPLALERSTLPEGPTRPAVLLVHGLAQNRYSWRLSGRSFSGWLASLGYDVLNLELRGHGRSRHYGAGNALTFHDYVDDLVRVASRCETPPFAIGHSLGAAVAVAAATKLPLRGVVHLAGVYTFASDNRVLRGIAKLSAALEPLLILPRVRVSTGWAGKLLGRLYSLTEIAGYGAPLAGWAPGSIERDLLAERLERGFDWTSLEVWLHMSRWAAGAPFDYHDAFTRTDVPLLVLTGDFDRLARHRDGLACFAASGSSDKQELHFDSFHHQVHWGHIDLILGRKAPEEVWPVIARWLEDRS